MPIPNWSDADLLAAWQRLLPRGRAWRRDASAVLTQVGLALMPTFSSVIQSGVNLLVDAFPSTTVDLIPEWEASLGLPDLCTPLGSSIQQQQAAIVEKLTRGGGQSVGYFIAVAAGLGYTITIVEGTPASRTWTVHSAPAAHLRVFRAGRNRAGDLLETIGNNTELECVLRQIAPADTILLFSYP